MKKQKKFSNNGFGKRFLSTVVSMAMVATLMPAVPAAQADAAEPELLKAGAINTTTEHVTQGQPFPSGTGGSTYFRIPAFIVTANGNLLAAADARYSTTGDGGGLDTIASVSKDGGETWSYSFPLYFPDSAGYAGTDATTIIDPMLVQDDDGTIYCMADVNPTGVTTMGGYTSPGPGTGYITVDGKERLALTSDYSKVNTVPTADTTSYDYYVGDWNEAGYAPVIKRADNKASEYAVDKWYNLYSVKGNEYVADLKQTQVNSETEIQQNAFYKGSKLHVYNTGYMMYAKSTDDGLTWGDPEILNPQIKRVGGDDPETALLVSPGQGLLTTDKTLIIPFYNHGDAEENSSIAWKDAGSNTWKRSNDVPGASNGGWWTSESEAVELSDGTIRLFARSNKGTVTYADATRDSSNNLVFSAPVDTGISCTSTCNVTAIKYSKKIDGKEAILVGMPGGSGRANGKIFTFLVNEDKSLTLKSTFSVPNSASCYAYSCMSELSDGTIGLLWEISAATIRYDNFNITELVTNGYIEGAEVSVDLWANETYTREYTIDREYITGMTKEPDAAIATAEVTRASEDGESGIVVGLHAHVANNDSNLSSFAADADTSLDFENAEFTVSSVEGQEDIYTIKSEKAGLYLTNVSGAGQFFSTDAGNMKIAKTEGKDTFRICKADGKRFVILYKKNMDFNSNTGYSDGDDQYELTLLEKQEKISDDDPVPGYKVVTEVTSGKKYLISYIWTDGSVIVLYPTNGTANQTKLVSVKDLSVAPKATTVTITGVAEGQTEAVIDGITYKINCKGNPKINMVAGQTQFFEGVQEYSSADANVATIEAGTESRNALFDCEGYSNGNLDGYSETPNWDINMLEAEFTVEKVGDNYTLYSPVEQKYLVNQNATNYFTNEAITQSLTPVENADGTISFEIRRVSDDNLNDRYVYFFYERMAFDAVSAKAGFETRGDFAFEFLEKQDTITNLDPIPGYKRVSEITSGKNYLVTEYYENDTESGIIVLYPRIGITNQSKLYQAVDVEGAILTAKAEGTVQVTIDGIVYDVKIGECKHDGSRRVPNAVAATCEEKGYSGDVYCALCNELIEKGTEIAPTGHNWDEGKVTTPATLESDGEMTYTCKNDSSHTRTEVITSLDFAKSELTNAIDTATAEAAKDIYTEATKGKLDTALAAANNVKDSDDKAAVVAALNDLQAAIDGLVTKEFQTALDSLNEIINREIPNLDTYTDATKQKLADARNAAKALIDSDNVTVAKLKAEYAKVQAAIDGLVTKAVQEKIDKLEDIVKTDVGDINSYTEATRVALTEAIEAANALLKSGKATEAELQAAYEKVEAALKGLVTQTRAEADKAMDAQLTAAAGLLGQKDVYTAESLAALQKAYDAAKAVRNDASKDAAAVTAAMDQLKKAVAGLTKIPAEPKLPAVGSTFEYKSAVYKVTKSAAKGGTVTFVKPAKKTNKKFTVPASAKKDGITFTVTAIAKGAFKNNKKLASVVIGKNVKNIGANAFSGDGKLKKITVKSKVLKKVGKKALKGINAKCTIKVPKAKKAAYKKIFKGKGQKASVKVK